MKIIFFLITLLYASTLLCVKKTLEDFDVPIAEAIVGHNHFILKKLTTTLLHESLEIPENKFEKWFDKALRIKTTTHNIMLENYWHQHKKALILTFIGQATAVLTSLAYCADTDDHICYAASQLGKISFGAFLFAMTSAPISFLNPADTTLDMLRIFKAEYHLKQSRNAVIIDIN